MRYPQSPWTHRISTIEQDFPVPTLVNAGFEDDTVAEHPEIGPVSGWSIDPPGSAGLTGRDVNAVPDNGRIPDGTRALIVSLGGEHSATVQLTQKITGLARGRMYQLVFYENANAASGGDAAGPFLEILWDGRTLIPKHLVKPVEAAGRMTRPFRRIESEPFPAQAETADLLIHLTTEETNRRTIFLDGFAITDSGVEAAIADITDLPPLPDDWSNTQQKE